MNAFYDIYHYVFLSFNVPVKRCSCQENTAAIVIYANDILIFAKFMHILYEMETIPWKFNRCQTKQERNILPILAQAYTLT